MTSGPAFHNYHLTTEDSGLTLAAVLRRMRSNDSWSQVRRLIHNRHVQVNGNLCVDDGRKLKTGDVLKVWKEPRAAPVKPDDVRIVHLDAHLLVVEKPAGVTTLRYSEELNWPDQRRQLQPTLDEMIRQILARKTKSRAARPVRGHIPVTPSIRPVHRLDRDTSGLMVFARLAEAERRLVQMFRKHDMHRAYLAIAHGEVHAHTIETQLVRDRGDGLRGSSRKPGAGQRAVTHIRPIEHLEGYTLVECRLETGRTHQIRIHLAEAGHMVCGEKVYTHSYHGQPTNDRSGAQRQALHAAELGFAHPMTGKRMEFKTPLPPDMTRLLERLRGRKPKPEA
ncbi:MAG: RluA family pseudouridine synthase [Planctomycetota bacterium]